MHYYVHDLVENKFLVLKLKKSYLLFKNNISKKQLSGIGNGNET